MSMMTTTIATKSSIAGPPIVSRRNKSLVSLQESLQKGFMKHNLYNRSGATLCPVMEERTIGFKRPAHVSPSSSSNDLQQQLQRALNTQAEHRQQPPSSENEDPSPRPIKKRKIFETSLVGGPATVATEASSEHDLVIKRKALAAKLRAGGVKLMIKPSEFARSLYCKNRTTETTPTPTSFSDPGPIETEIHSKHSQVLYDFVRKGTDLEGFKECVRELHEAYHGEALSYGQRPPFRCANRFGESLLHLACRRGRTDMVRFLVVEMGSSPREMLNTMDDCHKTPLHDACWTPSPNFELVQLLLELAPEQVVTRDVRGNTPFDYVRPDDYKLWLRFLWGRRSLLQWKEEREA